MRVDSTGVRPVPPLRRRRLLWPCLLAAAAGAAAGLGIEPAKVAISDWAYAHGHHRIDKQNSFYRALWSVPGRMLRGVDAPRLVLDVPFKHMRKIYLKRSEALAKGLLETEDGDLVPGRLSLDGASHEIKLRLKGDWTDHLEGRKWSFRIQVSGDGQVFGMRRFSIQNPATKCFHGEALFHAMMREVGVIAPRYFFVRVTLNGDDLGVMAVEEHFTKELLESQHRRDAVITRFDETLMFHGADDYRTAEVRPFQSGRVEEEPALVRQNAVATALLRAFVDGVRPAGEVFVVEELARFLAVAELWGTYHPMRWHNMRFYYEPITGRLGPIAFDGNLHQRHPVGELMLAEPIVQRMFADPAMLAAFVAELRALCARVTGGDLVDKLRGWEREHLALLQTEFVLLEPFDWNELVERARFHAGLEPAAFRYPGSVADHPLWLRAYRVATVPPRLELVNALPEPLDVVAIRWVTGGRDGAVPFDTGGIALPLRLAPQVERGAPVEHALPCPPPPDGAWDRLEVVAERIGGARAAVLAIDVPDPARAAVVPTSTAGEQLAAHPFLRAGDDGALHVAGGEWMVATHLVVPPGHSLTLEAGARLRFAPGAALVAHGPVHCAGTAERPVILEPAAPGGDWPGVAVVAAGGPCEWRHAVVRSTRATALGDWELTGAVTFYRTDVTLDAVTFSGTLAEDALNVVRARCDLRGVRIEDTASDAFDGDFVEGSVRDSEFARIGGDGVDVSGSELTVAGCRFDDVRDKALSVGEASRVRAGAIDVRRAGTAAACKDSSVLEIDGMKTRDLGFAAITAYVKKPTFGPATVHAAGLDTGGVAGQVRVQLGCTVVLDGVEVPGEDIDVDALYETVMRKDGGR